jgi:hypothetical protein
MPGERAYIESSAGMGAQEQQRFKLGDGIDVFDDELSYVVRDGIRSHSQREEGPTGNLPDPAKVSVSRE